MTVTINGTTGITTPALDSSGPLTSLGIDDNATSTAITIDASNNVGIGTTTQSSYYAKDLVVNSANEGGITIVGGTADTQYLMFADGTSGADRYRGYIEYSHSQDHMNLSTNGTERMKIDSAQIGRASCRERV